MMLILIISLVFLIACNPEREIQTVEFEKKRTISIPLMESTANKAYMLSFYAYDKEQEKEFIIHLYMPEFVIYIYDLTTSQLYKKIKTPAPLVPFNLYYLNRDSIFLSDYNYNRLALIDENGTLKNAWFTKASDSLDVWLSGISSLPMYVSNNKLISLGGVSTGLNISNGYYKSSPAIFEFSLKGSNYNLVSNSSIPYSNTFKTDTVWYEDNTSFAVRKGKIYVSFGVEHQVYCYDENHNVSIIPAKSKYLGKFLPYDRNRALNISYIDSMFRIMPYYEGIVYDQFRDIFFRKAVHQIPISNDGQSINNIEDNLFQ